MFCQNCGFNNNDGVSFCAGCGAPLKKVTLAPPPVSVPKKKNPAFKIIAVVLAVIVAASALLFVIPKEDKPYIVYVKDNQLYLTFEGEKEHILLDDELVRGYGTLSSSQKNSEMSSVSRILEYGFGNNIIYRKTVSSDPTEYEYVGYSAENGDVKKVALPYQINEDSDYSVIPSKDNSKVYFKYKKNIYTYNFDTIEKLVVDAYEFRYCPETDRIVYALKNENDGEYNRDYYFINPDGNLLRGSIVSEAKNEFMNTEKDIYVFSDYNGDYCTFINGVKSEIVLPNAVTDDAKYISIINCTDDGTLFISVRREVNEKNEWTYYLCKNGEYKTVPDRGEMSDDGKKYFLFEDTSEEDDEYYGTLTEYEVDGLNIIKVADYNNVSSWNILPNNGLLLWKNRQKNNDPYYEYGTYYTYDLYYNDLKIGSDVFARNPGGGKGGYDYVTFFSKESIIFFTDTKCINDKGDKLFTLNVFDGKETEEIAYNVANTARATDDGKVIFVSDWDKTDNAGDLKVYDGKKTEEIAYGVNYFYAPDFVERIIS